MSVQVGVVPVHESTWSKGQKDSLSTRQVILALHEKEHVPLLRYAMFLGLVQESAEDVVQECFLKLHRHLLADGDQSNLRAWLYRVAHNAVRSRQSGSEEVELDNLSESAPRFEPTVETASPEDTLLSKERAKQLRKAMGQLSSAQRECLMLRAQGLKYREIAASVGLSTSTVAEHVSRSLEQLRNLV